LLATLLVVTSGCFPQRDDHLPHFARVAPQVGETAPEFELRDSSGAMRSLADVAGGRPLVLMLSSYTCPVFRYRSLFLNSLWAEFKDRVSFAVVYTREAHPVGSKSPYAEGEWVTGVNYVTWNLVEEPRTEAERAEIARYTKDELTLSMPVLVDTMSNATWNAYGRAPSPIFLIDVDGHVVERQAWVDPDNFRDAVRELLESSPVKE
jgi:peroxiredoxin